MSKLTKKNETGQGFLGDSAVTEEIQRLAEESQRLAAVEKLRDDFKGEKITTLSPLMDDILYGVTLH